MLYPETLGGKFWLEFKDPEILWIIGIGPEKDIGRLTGRYLSVPRETYLKYSLNLPRETY